MTNPSPDLVQILWRAAASWPWIILGSFVVAVILLAYLKLYGRIVPSQLFLKVLGFGVVVAVYYRFAEAMYVTSIAPGLN